MLQVLIKKNSLCKICACYKFFHMFCITTTTINLMFCTSNRTHLLIWKITRRKKNCIQGGSFIGEPGKTKANDWYVACCILITMYKLNGKQMSSRKVNEREPCKNKKKMNFQPKSHGRLWVIITLVNGYCTD